MPKMATIGRDEKHLPYNGSPYLLQNTAKTPQRDHSYVLVRHLSASGRQSTETAKKESPQLATPRYAALRQATALHSSKKRSL